MGDYLFTNGVVISMEGPDVSYPACAVRDGRILAVGNPSDLTGQLGAGYTEVDLRGGALIPGLVDCHLHFVLSAYFRMNMDLAGVRSISELQGILKEKAAKTPKGGWLMGLRFQEDDYSEGRMPTVEDLDLAAPDHPVVLIRYDGHTALVNSQAMKAANITVTTPAPAGGVIGREGGRLTGVLQEKAMELIMEAVPVPEAETFMEGQRLFSKALLSQGVVGYHNVLMTSDNGPSGALGPFEVPLYKMFEPEMPFYHYPLVAADTVEEALNVLTEHFGAEKKNGRWQGGALKLFADGTFGSRTALFSEDYTDRPGERGYLVNSLADLREIIFKAHEEGLQTAVHAIGDAAIEGLVDIHLEARERFGAKDLRHRLEHASLIRPEVGERIRQADLVMSFQPTFILSEAPWIANRVGKRLDWVYPVRRMVDLGTPCCGGSDSPIEEPRIMTGIWALTAREGFTSGQSVSPYEALMLHTSGAAYTCFQEGERGKITPGRRADLTVLNKNPLTIPKQELKDIHVNVTMINGEIAYQRGADS
jgi:predicted amidohydrolase YtcJ